MNEKINITKEDGAIVNADIICFIENTNTTKRYVYYTLNEIVGAGANSTVKIYVSKIKQDNSSLDEAITNEEWGVLKGYMGNALKDITSPEVKYLPLSELINPISVSERAIAMPTSYDYINKQRGLYAQAVATAPSAEPTPSAPEPVEPISAAVEPEPAPMEPTPEVAPVEPMAEPTPASEPIAPAPMEAPVEEAIAPNTPAEDSVQTAMEEVAIAPQEVTPAPIVEEDSTASDDADDTGTGAILQPIDIATIEAKYREMQDTLDRLKNQEIEAAKRYNATLELSTMHKEQHASYVQNEQIKEAAEIPTVDPVTNSVPEPIAPVTLEEPTPVNEAPVIEPVQETVTPIEPAPIESAPQDLETNWFDMPNN